MKILTIFSIILAVTILFLGVQTYRMNNKIKQLDALAGQRIGVIENFLKAVSQQPDGSNVYDQYLIQLQGNLK